MSQGSGLVLLYHLMGEQDGHHGVWGFHKGGNGGFTQVLQRAAQGFGATVRLESPVDHVISKDGRATGVALADGTEFAAPIVVSALDPRRTFTELVDPRELPSDLNEAIDRYRFQGTSAKVNFALDDLPVYPALKGRSDLFGGFVNIGPSIEYLERAYDDAKYGWYSQKPFIDGAIQSVVDPDMAPPGKHVMSCFIQYAPYELKGGDWETERAAVRRHRAGRARVALPGLRRPGAAPRGRDAGRHRAGRRADRGEHLPRRVPGAADVLHAAGPRLRAVQHPDRGLLPVRLRHPPRRLRERRPGQARGDADPGRPSEEGMTAWLLLASAIVSEVTASLSLKRALDQPAFYAVVAAGYVAAFVLLTLTLKQGMGIGIAYGIWAGCGVALTAVASKVFFSEPLTEVMMVGIVLIIGGVLLVELGASH